MKNLILSIALLFSITASAQTKSYFSHSGEMIFSFAKVKYNGKEESSNLRWSPVFNAQLLHNYDLTQHFGVFYGLNIKNVGFIFDIPNSDTMMKFRTYNLGVPVGIKLGNVNGTFLYGGYEIEFPFHYKEKLFVDDDKKDVNSYWFSNRVNTMMQGPFVGINFKGGLNLKFKYYNTAFFNKNYSETVNGAEVKPYQNLEANVFYFSIDFNVFKDVKAPKRKFTGENDAIGTAL